MPISLPIEIVIGRVLGNVIGGRFIVGVGVNLIVELKVMSLQYLLHKP